MNHVDEGTLQALVDGELTPDALRAAEWHLAGCAECAAALGGQRRVSDGFAEAHRELRAPPATREVRDSIRRRARRGRPAPARGALRRAALLLLASGAVASATVPGSPVREWLGLPGESRPRAAPAPRPAPVPTVAAPMAEAPLPGVSILPVEGRVRVLLQAPVAPLRVRARLGSGERAEAYSAGGRFRTAPGRIEVIGAGPGEVRIEIPLGAVDARVEVDGVLYLLKEGEQLRLLRPAAERAGEAIFEVEA